MRPPTRKAFWLACLAAVGVVLGILGVSPMTSSPSASAADLSQFRAGNIISDAVFFNSSAMTEGEVQAFLEARVPRCQSGYTCLRDKWDVTRSTSTDAMCSAYPGGGNERASTIIVKVARACGINPQVLLVMLQKEQGLVTHTWPSDWRYTIAMGQGCPDTAACDTRYYGFFNQVYGAAWQLKRYANPPGTSAFFTWYAPGRTWNVRFNPNAACGTSPVYIENQATANLYYYTPYQPNVAALNAGYGEGDGCSAYGNRNFFNYFSDWFGLAPRNVNPFGNIEVLRAQPGAVRVAGWAADPETANPIEVHVYVGGVGRATVASIVRADVGAIYPSLGSAHGFDITVPVSSAGPQNVCAYGINVGAGTNTLLRCATVQAMSGSPFGLLEAAVGATGGVSVSGWAIDPDTADPIETHVYVDGVGAATRAGLARGDIAAAFPAYGAAHGFNFSIGAAPGVHRVCAYGIDIGPGENASLGCTTVVVPTSGDLGRKPVGNYESVSVSDTTATLTGWALDQDGAAPITVRATVGSTTVDSVAQVTRPDVGAAFPGLGDGHGFSVQIQVPYGDSTVCLTAINSGLGGDTSLGCRSVRAAPTSSPTNRATFGNFEGIAAQTGGALVVGWAIDPDSMSSIQVHAYVDGAGVALLANKSRPDVAAAFPGYGDQHGFVDVLPMTSGSHRVCIYAIDTAGGTNTTLGCRQVTVP